MHVKGNIGKIPIQQSARLRIPLDGSISIRCARMATTIDVPEAILARERAELYYLAHPDSPSAVRRPRLSRRSRTWIALLGDDIPDGIAGFGATVESALGAFDRQYFAALRPSVRTPQPV